MEDYNEMEHDFHDTISNHETSLDVFSRSTNEDDENVDDEREPAPKKARMHQPSLIQSPVFERTGIG